MGRLSRRLGVAPALAAILVAAVPCRAKQAEEKRILVSSQDRLVLEKDVLRVAVGDPETLTVESLTARELLVVGKTPGRGTVLVWYRDGTTGSFPYRVTRDFSLLEEILDDIHESIEVEVAPDRDAVVLRGHVPDISYSNVAEATALKYLGAGRRRDGAPAVRGIGDEGREEGEAGRRFAPVPAVEAQGAVINLITVETLPMALEERLTSALRATGGQDIHVKRVVRGDLRDDERDVFVLEGEVANQTALSRVLHIASALVAGRTARGDKDIRVVADESGALRTGTGAAGRAGEQGTGGTGLRGTGLSLGGSGRLDNDLDTNIGRATAISLAGGRVLSLLRVRDLPQVRVDVRFYEVNRDRLRGYSSDFIALLSDFAQGGLNPSAGGTRVQGDAAARVGANGEDVQNTLEYLAGQSRNQFQLSGAKFAINWTLTFLETKGLARSLSRPSTTMLSGETATFQVGGEIPVPESFTPTTDSGVFSSVTFRPFGVVLRVRPLVGEHGRITMDVAPSVSLPDAALTAVLRETTGRDPETAAFETRSLRTTAAVQDGESLLIGGLVSRRATRDDGKTPVAGDIPVFGWLFRNYNRSETFTDLVVVVNPVVVRERSVRARLWAFPTAFELASGAERQAKTDTPEEVSGETSDSDTDLKEMKR